MQVISVNNSAQDLCTKLASVAVPGFFDSVEMESGSTTTVQCKKDGTVVLAITQSTQITLTLPEGSTKNVQGGGEYFDIIVATSKAIYLKTSTSNTPVIIAKDTSGELAVVVYFYNNTIYPPSASEGTEQLRVYSGNGEDVAVYSYYLNNAGSTAEMYAVPMRIFGDAFVDGVYVALVRPYTGIPGYVGFTSDGNNFVGYGCTTFIVQDS